MAKQPNIDKRLVAYANIFLLANRLQTVMNIGMQEITARQWLPVIMLDTFPAPPTLKELASACGITHQSTKQLIDKLEEKGYVRVEVDTRDRRAIRIHATEKVRQWEAIYADRNSRFINEVFSDLTEAEIDTLLSVDQKLFAKLSGISEEPEKYEF